jgi:hypothetical protein
MGNVTNTNLGTALEEAIVGSADVTFASGNVTLTLTDTNASQTARHMRLRCTGTTGGSTRNLVVPSIEKPYIVANDCADSIVVKTAAGTGITVPAGKTMWVYSDGTNVVNVTTHLSSLTLGTPLPISSGGTGSSTALTQGSVVFAGAAGVFSQDNANFFWDDTNNQLGIGTATPTYKIEARTDAVSGFNWISSFNNTATGSFGAGFLARSSAGSAYLYMRGDGLAYVENSTNNALAFATNATEKMRITAAGDVGIGATTVTERLQVNVGTGASGFEKGISLTNGVDANLFNYVTGTAATDKRAFITAGAANQSLAFGTLYTERMRITSAGDVGVGTTAPSGYGKLAVIGGNIGVSQDSTTVTTIRGNAGISNIGAFSSTGASLTFSTAPSGSGEVERMRITSTGLVGIGATPSVARLEVNGSIRTTVGSGGTLTLHETDATRANQLISGADAFGSYINASFATGGSAVLRFQTANTEHMRVNSLGNVGIGTNTPGARLEVFNDGTTLRLNTALVGGNLVDINPFVAGVSNSGFSITVGSNIRQVINSTGLVGFGTTAPWERLSIPFNDGLAFGDATYSYKISRSSSGTLVTTFADSYNDSTARVDFTMRAGAVNALSMLGSGNVGIGTTAPATRFHAAGITRISDATNSTAVNIDASTAAGLTSIIAQFGGSQLALGAAATEYVRINASGNVGIGTTSPSTKLDVNGSLRANSLTLTTALAVAQGGTGATDAATARSNLSAAASGAVTSSGITMSTARILGRTTASTGAIEEISIGSGLSLTGGTLSSTAGGGTVTSVGGTGSANGLSLSGTVTTSGNLTLSGSVTSVATGATIDGVTIGYRSIPRSTTTTTAVVGDVGKCIAVSAGITIPNATFAAGDAVSIYNDSASAVTITQGASLTLRQAGTANTGNRTLAARGMATIWFNSSSEAIISGAGVS